MVDRRRTVAGFVLAGGASSRMGCDKALLEVGGEPLVVRIARQVEASAGSATIVGPPARYGHLGYEVVPDRTPGIGPLGGIETALSLARAKWNLVLACDLAAIDRNTLEGLLDKALGSQADCVLARWERPEPLLAVYSLTCAAQLRAAVEAGIRKVTESLEGLDIEWYETGSGDCLTNLNTPGDLEAFRG